MDIKEIALQAGLANFDNWQGDGKTLMVAGFDVTDQVIRTVEKAVAEIQRKSEPVAWGCPGHPETFVSNNKKQNSGYQSMVFFSEPLFTFPPDKDSIEQRVAEAICELLESQHTWITKEAASALIRSGEYRKFMNEV